MVYMKDMFDAGVHLGHQAKFLHPKMKEYIFGIKSKLHIINLDKTLVMFNDALKAIKHNVKNNGTVLFVGTRKQASEIVEHEAKRAGMPYVTNRWLGGLLTNFNTVKSSIRKFKDKTKLLESSTEHELSKKEILDLTHEIHKLKLSIGGIVDMTKPPTMLFVVDTGYHSIAVKEAKRLGIPVVGIVDTNNDPSEIDYPIPGNDDSIKSISFYVAVVSNIIIEASKEAASELVNTDIEILEKIVD